MLLIARLQSLPVLGQQLLQPAVPLLLRLLLRLRETDAKAVGACARYQVDLRKDVIDVRFGQVHQAVGLDARWRPQSELGVTLRVVLDDQLPGRLVPPTNPGNGHRLVAGVRGGVV